MLSLKGVCVGNQESNVNPIEDEGFLNKPTYNNHIPNIQYSGSNILTWTMKRLRCLKRGGHRLTYRSGDNRVPSEGNGKIDEQTDYKTGE